jgi:predicted nucleotidyltransferase
MQRTTTIPRPREKIRLEPVTPGLLGEVVRRIVAAVDPDQIILFGSYAHGKPHEYSDIDVLVVKSGLAHPMDLVEEIYGLFWDKAIAMDVLVSSPDRIERELAYGNSFLRTQILERGRILYERTTAAT